MLDTGTQPVPFLDLGLAHRGLKDEILEAIAELIDTNAYSNGPQVAEFERAFATFAGAEHCVGVANGLDALRLGLLAAGIEPGDEVVVPAMTFVATAEAVTQAGATPVFADIREDDFGLDPEAVEAAVTSKTKAIMPVHLYGQMVDLRRLGEIAAQHGLLIVEDACQAHGATRDGLRAGVEGIAGAFSFYPGKNLGAMGDAGALVTRDAGLAERVRALREHGQTRKYHHEYDGYTSRLDTIQALVLLRKLPELARWNAERRAVAGWYAEALDGVGDLRLPETAPSSEHVWHLYVVRTQDPTRLADDLRECGIGTGRHYPEPVHTSTPFSQFTPPGASFPVAEAVARECLSLPIFPGMTEAQAESVVQAVRASFAARA